MRFLLVKKKIEKEGTIRNYMDMENKMRRTWEWDFEFHVWFLGEN